MTEVPQYYLRLSADFGEVVGNDGRRSEPVLLEMAPTLVSSQEQRDAHVLAFSRRPKKKLALDDPERRASGDSKIRGPLLDRPKPDPSSKDGQSLRRIIKLLENPKKTIKKLSGMSTADKFRTVMKPFSDTHINDVLRPLPCNTEDLQDPSRQFNASFNKLCRIVFDDKFTDEGTLEKVGAIHNCLLDDVSYEHDADDIRYKALAVLKVFIFYMLLRLEWDADNAAGAFDWP